MLLLFAHHIGQVVMTETCVCDLRVKWFLGTCWICCCRTWVTWFYFGLLWILVHSTDFYRKQISIQRRPLHFCCARLSSMHCHPIARDCNARIHKKSSTKYFPSWFWYRYPSCCDCGRYGRFKLYSKCEYPHATMIDANNWLAGHLIHFCC